MDKSYNYYQEQTIGSISSIVNESRIRELNEELIRITQNKQFLLGRQQEALGKALEQVNNIREFLKSPEHILGSTDTKHGEIAEVIEVNIRNAKSLLEQQFPSATFEGINRTDLVDYLIDGIPVQAKFINGLNNNLTHVLKHMEQYPGFVDKGYYHIPKDQYQLLKDIKDGRPVEGLSDNLNRKILSKINAIESRSGKGFGTIVRPSISNYSEVQLGVVSKTVDGHEEQLHSRNKEIEARIYRQTKNDRQRSINAHKPSWKEATKVSVLGVVIGGGFSIALCVYKKYKEGRKLYQFNENDWKDIGIEFVKNGTKGGITGIAIYGITNFTKLGAPLASSFVSATFGVASLARSYARGDITSDVFLEQGQVVCFEAGAIALGATVGQTVIPIPIVGTLIGTFASKIFISICKDSLGSQAVELEKVLNRNYYESLSQINQAYKITVEQIVIEYEKLGQITHMAFDYRRNAVFRFDMSIKLALVYGVKESNILRNVSDVDSFMLS